MYINAIDTNTEGDVVVVIVW